MKPRQSNFWKVFGTPLVIALLSAAGLFAALLGDGLGCVELGGARRACLSGPKGIAAARLKPCGSEPARGKRSDT